MTLSRRAFLAAGAATLSLPAIGRINAAEAKAVRIGTVFPSKTGPSFVRASVNDFIGDGGRMGAMLAESQLGGVAEANGLQLKLLTATSPTVEAAVRAGERLVETGDICALVGGIGDGQAHELAKIAAKAKIPFFNVGETDDALRGAGCSRYVFHVEASDAMYLDAMAMVALAQGQKKWHVVTDTTRRGKAMLARLKTAAGKVGATVVGETAVPAALSIYYDDVDRMKDTEADLVMVLLQAFDQFSFILQMEEAGIKVPVSSFPHTITQTRDFIAAARYRLPTLNPRLRVALWETTNPAPDAHAFNELIRAQWGEGADPTAWSSYHAIKIILETVMATGSTEAEALIDHLEKPDTAFDALKGTKLSFRPWDHQLRQPLFTIAIDQDAEWSRMDLDSRINVAKLDGSLPSGEAGADPQAWLDSLGDVGEGTCGA
ncbi:ABC transporter substrate-binding protein [Devosia sp. D6-9]|nr:ABC transporter substrate-binding protein [Devosia sp. D6-9]